MTAVDPRGSGEYVCGRTIQKNLWRMPAGGILEGSMIPDISLGIVFSLIFFGLGIVAFAYLAKGKN